MFYILNLDLYVKKNKSPELQWDKVSGSRLMFTNFKDILNVFFAM